MSVTQSSIAVTEGSGKNLDTVVVNTDKHRETVAVGHPDAANAGQFIKPTAAGGVVVDDGGSSITVDGSVSVSASALPTGAATDASVQAVTAALGTTLNVAVVSNVGAGGLTNAQLRATPVPVDASGAAIPVTDNSSSLTVDDGGSSLTVDGTVAVSGSVAVTGTFFQATQPVSIAAAVPITDNSGSITVDGTVAVTGVSTAAKQPALGTAGSASADVITIQGIASMTKLLVTPDLPSGASTAAKQPALGTAGSPSSDVLTVQGVSGGTGLSSSIVSAPKLEVSFTTTTVQAVGSTDATNYSWVSVHIAAQGGSSSVAFQASNDNSNWVTVALTSAGATGTGTPSTVSTTTGMWVGPLPGRYFRLNVTGIASGTTSGVIEFSPVPNALPAISAFVTASTTPVRLVPNTSGGSSVATGSVGATATSVKSSAGQMYGFDIFNPNTSPVYMQVFNTATGSVTLGTTAPVMSIGIPAGGGKLRDIANGIAFSTAITIAFTTTRAGLTGPSSTVDYNVDYS